MNEDFKWFTENLDVLYGKYGDSYIAIKNKTVLGSYETLIDGVNETKKTEELGTFIVQKCGNSSECYTTKVTSVGLLI